MPVSKFLLLKLISALPDSWRTTISRLRWHHPGLNRIVAYAAQQIRQSDLIIQEGIGRGLRFNSGGSAARFIIGSSQFLEQLALRALITEGMNFYDIGANVGFFAVIAARLLGPSGRVICFEPLPRNFRQLRYNSGLNGFNNIEVIEAALGNFDGETEFWTSAEPTWGKLAGTGKYPDKMNGRIKVALKRLDAIIEEASLPPPDVIKIDVEGAEVDVLKGAMKTLSKYRPSLLIELHGTNEAVGNLLWQASYKSAVIGDSAPIAKAHWNASVLAIPVDSVWPADFSSLVANVSA